MFDLFPYPDITATNSIDLAKQVSDYLIRLKESLEFELSSISYDNLSPDFQAKLDALGVDINANKEEREASIQQVIVKTVTVSDVISSTAFDNAIDEKLADVAKSGTLFGVSLNDIKHNFKGWATGCTEIPDESGDGVLEVVVSSSGNVMQQYTNVGSKIIATRWYSATSQTWDEWTYNT